MGAKDTHCSYHGLLIEKYLLKDISPEDEKRLESHLKDCDQCRHDITMIEKNNKILNSEKTPSISKNFKERLNKNIEEIKERFSQYKKLHPFQRFAYMAAIIPFIIAFTITLVNFTSELQYKTALDVGKYYDEIPKLKGGYTDKKLHYNIDRTVNKFFKENKIAAKNRILIERSTSERPIYGKRFIGKICDCWMNKPENIQIKDGEIVYVVIHHNYRGHMLREVDIKESDLVAL